MVFLDSRVGEDVAFDFRWKSEHCNRYNFRELNFACVGEVKPSRIHMVTKITPNHKVIFIFYLSCSASEKSKNICHAEFSSHLHILDKITLTKYHMLL